MLSVTVLCKMFWEFLKTTQGKRSLSRSTVPSSTMSTSWSTPTTTCWLGSARMRTPSRAIRTRLVHRNWRQAGYQTRISTSADQSSTISWWRRSASSTSKWSSSDTVSSASKSRTGLRKRSMKSSWRWSSWSDSIRRSSKSCKSSRRSCRRFPVHSASSRRHCRGIRNRLWGSLRSKRGSLKMKGESWRILS